MLPEDQLAILSWFPHGEKTLRLLPCQLCNLNSVSPWRKEGKNAKCVLPEDQLAILSRFPHGERR